MLGSTVWWFDGGLGFDCLGHLFTGSMEEGVIIAFLRGDGGGRRGL